MPKDADRGVARLVNEAYSAEWRQQLSRLLIQPPHPAVSDLPSTAELLNHQQTIAAHFHLDISQCLPGGVDMPMQGLQPSDQRLVLRFIVRTPPQRQALRSVGGSANALNAE
jgi:hypothetical protein